MAVVQHCLRVQARPLENGIPHQIELSFAEKRSNRERDDRQMMMDGWMDGWMDG